MVRLADQRIDLKFKDKSDAPLYLPFDSDVDDASGNGRTPSTESGGIIYPSHITPQVGAGAVQLAEATTNECTNPSAEVDTAGWTDGFGSIARITSDAYVGSACFESTADGSGDISPYDDVSLAGATAGRKFTIQARVKGIGGTVGKGVQFFLWELGGAAGAANSATSITLSAEWQFITLTRTIVENDRTALRLQFSDDATWAASAKFIFDAVQIEEKAYPTPYCDGTLGSGHSWAGTAHNSESSRTKTDVQYTLDLPSQFTISLWVLPWTKPSETTSVDFRIFDWHFDVDNRIMLFYQTSAAGVQLFWEGNNVVTTIDAEADLDRFTPRMYTVTYDGSTLSLYSNGSLVDTATPTAFASTPSILYIGENQLSAKQLNGLLDEWVVLDYALTASEVSLLHTEGVNAIAFDGVWTDISTDVSMKRRISAQYGIFGNGPKDRVARTGALDFLLRNDVGNSGAKQGYYSPDHANARSDFEIGKEVRLALTYSGSTFIKWRGDLASIRPSPGIKRDQTVRCRATDWFSFAAKRKMRRVGVAFNQRADEGIATILGSMDDVPPASSLATGQDTFPTVFDSTRDEQTTVLSELNKLTMSELGFLYPVMDQLTGGVLTFEDRHARAKLGSSSASISGSMVKMVSDRNVKNIFNRVKIEANPREISSAASVLFTLQSVPLLGVSASTIIEGRFTDPSERGAIRVGGASLVTPASTTDYLMNSASDGSGTDLTSSFSVSASYGGNSVRYSISNDGTQAGYITLLQARGRLLAVKEPTIAEKFDQSSIDDHGESVLPIRMFYQEDPLVVEDASNALLAQWKDPRTQNQYIEFIGNDSDDLMQQGLLREPGDKVTVVEEVTGLDQDFIIHGVKVSINKDHVVRFRWAVIPAESAAFWILGTVGSSELEVSTIPGY